MKLHQLQPLSFIAMLLVGMLAKAEPSAELNWQELGYSQQKLTDTYWIDRAKKPESVLLSPSQVLAANKRLATVDTSVSALQNWPSKSSAVQITDKINRISKRPARALYSQDGFLLDASRIDALVANLNLNAVQHAGAVSFGLTTKRSALRTFPSDLRAFSAPGDTDIDRFQESAVFPGMPVLVLHQSADNKWLFVQTELYAAWIKADAIATGSRETVLDYMTKQPRLIITGANVRTVFSPDKAAVSDLALDMGISLPLLEQWPNTQAVNGQGALAGHVIELPIRDDKGLLRFAPALVPRSADTRNEYLPVTRANILRQSFKFQGERYGWGHDYGTRDCSGFVSEVYRSMGILLPRNTGDQAKSPAFDLEPYDATISHAQRLKRAKQFRIGDLIYIPGHVMMVVGQDAYGPWVIHDSHGTGFLQNGGFHSVPTNGVAVTPLLSMAISADKSYLDAITAIQHIIPKTH